MTHLEAVVHVLYTTFSKAQVRNVDLVQDVTLQGCDIGQRVWVRV